MIILNPFIEIEPSENSWNLIDYFNRRKFQINDRSFLFLIDLAQGKHISSDQYNIFLKNGILIDDDNDDVKYFYKLKQAWEKYEWNESFKYHIATIDYPFQGNLKKASKKMEEYQLEKADSLREKHYSSEDILKIYALPKVKRDQKPDFTINPKENLKTKIFQMLSVTFGFVQEAVPGWGGEKLLFRTTSSGGSRQPSEGYLYAKEIEGVEPGFYYINGKKFELEKISNFLIPDSIFENLYSLTVSNTNINIQGVVILTSVFEKNMYRYREARTFRSIHMDIGFLSGLLEELSDRLGICSYVQYGIPDDYLENILKLNYFNEGYQASVVFGKEGEK